MKKPIIVIKLPRASVTKNEMEDLVAAVKDSKINEDYKVIILPEGAELEVINEYANLRYKDD